MIHENIEKSECVVFSVGHSNHALDKFIELLHQHRIKVIIDVRSHPYSQYAAQFDMPLLEKALKTAGIKYMFLGNELGGRPASTEFYDEEGRVDYSLIAQSQVFKEGISRMEQDVKTKRTAFMCGEEDPAECHRRLLIGRVLGEHGITMRHIRGDGRLQTEDDVAREESRRQGEEGQLLLFAKKEESPWKSIRSVSKAKQQPSSSER